MVDLSRKTYERNGIETIVDNDRILWLNEKHIEEGLDHKNLQGITINQKDNAVEFLKTKNYQSK